MSISPDVAKKIEKASKGDFITYEIDGRTHSGKIVAKDSDSFLILGRVEKSNGYGLLNDYVHNYGLAQADKDIKEEFDVTAICSYVWHSQVKDVRYYADIKPGDFVSLEWSDATKSLVTGSAPACDGTATHHKTIQCHLIAWDDKGNAICAVPGIVKESGNAGSKLRYLGVYQSAMPRLIDHYQRNSEYYLAESQGYMVVPGLVRASSKRPAFRYDAIVDFTPVASNENFDATLCQEIKAGDKVTVRERVVGTRYRIADNAEDYAKSTTSITVTVAAKFNEYLYVYVPAPTSYFCRHWDSYNYQGNTGSHFEIGSPGFQHIWCVRNAYWKKAEEEKKEPTPEQILADQKKAIKPGDLIEVRVKKHIDGNHQSICDDSFAYSKSSEKIYVEVAATMEGQVYVFVPDPAHIKFTAGQPEHYTKKTTATHPLFKTDKEHNRLWEVTNDAWIPAPVGAKLTYPAPLIEAKPIVESPPAETDMKSSKPAPKRIATARKVSSPTAHKDEKYMASPTPKKSIKDKLKKNLNDGMYMAAGEKGIRVMSDQLVKQLAKGDPARGLVAEMILKEPAAQALLKLLFGVGLDYVPKYGENPHLQQVADMLRTSGVRDGAVIGLDLLSTILTPAMEAALNSIPGMGTTAKEARVEETKARGSKRVGTLREVTTDTDEEEEEEAKTPARRARSAG